MKSAAVLALVTAVAAGCSSQHATRMAVAPGGSKSTLSVLPCRASQLRPHLSLQGATGKLLGGIAFAVTASNPCLLTGRPRVSLAGAPASVRWRIYPMRPLNGGRPIHTIRRGDRVVVDLSWSNWCANSAPQSFVIALPRGGGGFRARVPGTPRCNVPTQPSELGVGPFTASR